MLRRKGGSLIKAAAAVYCLERTSGGVGCGECCWGGR